MKIINRFLAPVGFAVLLHCIAPLHAGQNPKLVVLISVDQMMPEYLARFREVLNGGLRKLYTEGIVYDSCMLGYAFTETGPGHATLITGVFPTSHGIFMNDWWDPMTRERVYCVQDSLARPVDGMGGYRSPRNLRVTALGDWLKAASPLSRVVSISIKDRAAILMGGQRPDAVCWYSRDSGKFVSSSYYGRHLPGFAREFDADGPLRSVPDSWERFSAYCDPLTSPDSMPGEKTGQNVTNTFPHDLRANKAGLLQFTPFGDSLVLALGLAAVREMKLGGKGHPDLLCIGLSCTDYIGHYYGPNSVEMCDQVKRLDHYLSMFFTELDKQVSVNNCLIVLTSDHGMAPLPEYSSGYMGNDVHRVILEDQFHPAMLEADSIMKAELGVDTTMIDYRGFLNYSLAAEKGYPPVRFEEAVRKDLQRFAFIGDVIFRRELIGRTTAHRSHSMEFRRSYDEGRGPDFVIIPSSHYVFTERNYPAQHDLFCAHVPLMFWSATLKAQHLAGKALSIDIAPTIATYLGIAYPRTVAGNPLPEISGGIPGRREEETR